MRRLILTGVALAALALPTAAHALTTAQVEDQAAGTAIPIGMLVGDMLAANDLPPHGSVEGEPEDCKKTSRTRGSCFVAMNSDVYLAGCDATVVVTQRGKKLVTRVHNLDCWLAE